MKRPTRVPSQLSEFLIHQLNAYTVAASAAGVGVLGLPHSAQAKIIYTPAHVVLHAGSTVNHNLDVNHDSVVDFALMHFHFTAQTRRGHKYFLSSVLVPSNTAVNSLNGVVGQSDSAYALRAGDKIGTSNNFRREGNMAEAYGVPPGTPLFFSGAWANNGKGLQNRYLGLRFVIKGTIHFGWARVSVSTWPFAATLTGYAYETIPNKPIIAGKTHGRDEATLGRLAQGASAVSNGRKP